MLWKYNISAIVGTPTASPPSWLMQQYPTMQLMDINGARLRYGSRQNMNHVHPGCIQATEDIVTAIGKHYANDPRVAAFQIDNEIHGELDYSPITQQAFQQWLQTKYNSSIDLVNQVHGNVFWSHTYNSFEDIPLPWNTLDGSHNPGLALDYRRFIGGVGAGYLELQAAILRQVAPSKPLTHNCMGSYPNVDYSRFGNALDVVAWDNYPLGFNPYPITDDTIYNTALGAAFTRGAKNGVPFYVMEQQAANIGQADYYGTGFLEGYRLMAWQDVANGADGVQFFRWRTTRVGFEQHWEGILNWDGSTTTRRYNQVAKMGQEFAKASPYIFGTTVKARVGILYSPETGWAFMEQAMTNPAFTALPQFKLLLTAFRQNRVMVDVVYIPADTGAPFGSGSSANAQQYNFSQYDILLAPTLWVVPDSLAAAINQFVLDGGHLLLSMRAGSKTFTNAYTSQTLPGPFAELAGIMINEWDPQCTLGETGVWGAAPAPVGYFPVSTSQARICEVLEINTTVTPAAQIIGTYSQGYNSNKGAVSYRKLGANGGSVIYAGTVADNVQFYSWMAQMLAADAGIAFGPQVPSGVEVSTRSVAAPASGGTCAGPDGTYTSAVFIINYNEAPTSLVVPEAAGGTDVLSGTVINANGNVTVPGWEVFVVPV